MNKILYSIVFYSWFCLTSSAQQYIPLRFFVDPSHVFFQPAYEIQYYLNNYVNDLNTILSKNTNKRFFLSSTTIKNYDNEQFWDGTATSLPQTGYPVWVDVDYTSFPFSHNGEVTWNSGGQAVLGNLRWPKFYNPQNPSDLKDYWYQITAILHEYAHVFGAGIGEYYNIKFANDHSGVQPYHALDISNQNDPFWINKPNFINDPLTWSIYNNYLLGYPITKAALISNTQFDNITANIINYNYRFPFYNISTPTTVKFITMNQNNVLLSNVLVDIRDRYGNVIYVTSSNDGVAVYEWNYQFWSWDILRLAKFSKEGYTNKSRWFSSFDLQWAAQSGFNEFVIWVVF